MLRTQKRRATMSVSLHILHWKNTLPWAQTECSEDTQSVKCSAGEHLGFFWSDTDVIYGLTPPLHQASTVLWWKWRSGILIERGMLKVWEVTPEKAFSSTSVSSLISSWKDFIFSNVFFLQVRKWEDKGGAYFPSQFPISSIIVDSLIFLVRMKWFYPRLVSQTLMECNMHAFCCFKPKLTAFLSQHLSVAAWRENEGFFSAQDELMWLANYFCTFCRAARIKVIAENERTGPP